MPNDSVRRSRTPHRICAIFHFAENEQGQSLLECALILPILALLLAGTVDFGRAWYVSLEVSSAAEAGSLYGVLNPTDVQGMTQAAMLDASDSIMLHASATFGSECSDGTSVQLLSSPVPVCAVNSVTFVEVDTTATYTPLLRYPSFLLPSTLSAKTRMRTLN